MDYLHQSHFVRTRSEKIRESVFLIFRQAIVHREPPRCKNDVLILLKNIFGQNKLTNPKHSWVKGVQVYLNKTPKVR